MSRGRTASHESTGEIPAIDEGLWLELMAPEWQRWALRARNEQLTENQRTYAGRRAHALGRPYTEPLAECARGGVVVKCKCPGRRDVRWYTCRRHLLCRLCRKQRSRKLRAKIHAALDARLQTAGEETIYLRRMYTRPQYHLVMATLTLRPSGNIAADRARLADGWRRYYKANVRRWGVFSYVGTWELHKTGTPHIHVVCCWPVGSPGDRTQGDWRLQRELWLQSINDTDDERATRVNFRASRNAGKASRYISKYVSKGVQTDDFSPELRSRVLAATYNTRWVFASRGAWVPFVPCCPDCGASVVRARFKFPDATPLTSLQRLARLGWSVRWGPEGTSDDADESGRQLALALSERGQGN